MRDGIQEKGQRNGKAPACSFMTSAALGGSTTHKGSKTANSEKAGLYQDEEGTQTRRKPGYAGSRSRKEPGQVILTIQDPGILSSDSFSHGQITQLICQLITQLNLRLKKTIPASSRNRGSDNSLILVERQMAGLYYLIRKKKTKKYIKPPLTHHSDPRKPKHEESSTVLKSR